MPLTRGIGGILMQEDKVIRFFSMKLNKSEQNYTIIEKECFALIKSLEFFKNIIYGFKIKILTDNRNLTYLNKTTSHRIQRWKLILENYDYTINHISAKENKLSGFLI